MVARMAKLGREEVLKIATLARLKLSDQEITAYQEKMGRVLEHIAELSALDTPKDAFVKHVPLDAEPFRADAAVEYGASDLLLKNAPAVEARHFLLPKVVEHGE